MIAFRKLQLAIAPKCPKVLFRQIEVIIKRAIDGFASVRLNVWEIGAATRDFSLFPLSHK
jgi:hypothetical protein